MPLSSKEIETWNNHKTDSKRDLHACQRVFLAHNPNESSYCMCQMTKRKIKRKQFDEWYAEITN